jgi:HlyD family secretion protein
MYNLGEIQPGFENFQNMVLKYRDFILLGLYPKQIKFKQEELSKYNVLLSQQRENLKVAAEELRIAEEQHKMAKKVFKSKIISESEFINARSKFLGSRKSYFSAQTSVTNSQLQINKLQQTLQELKLQQQKEENELVHGLLSTLKNFKSQLVQWEMKYLIKASISGNVTYTKFWSVNQNVKAGNVVLTIVPEKSSRIIGKILLPVAGAGKVKTGQRVNIKLIDYPFREYGMVRGVVEAKSLVAEEEKYSVMIALPQGLKTNYGKDLVFNKKMNGQADIITEDISLFLRIVNPIRAILSK